MSQRPSVSSKTIYIGLFVSLLLAMAFALFVYFRYIRFEPRALGHLAPETTSIVASMNIEQAVVYEPFRRHLLSLVEADRKGKESRLRFLEGETGLELGVDTREIALGISDAGASVLVGGLFRRERFARGVKAVLDDDGESASLAQSPERVIGPLGTEIAMLSDGVIAIGTSNEMLLRSVQAGRKWPEAVGKVPVLVVHSGRQFGGGLGGFDGLTEFSLTISAGTEAGSAFLLHGRARGARPLALEGVKAAFSPIRLENAKLARTANGEDFLDAGISRGDFDRLVAIFGNEIGKALRIP